MIAEIKVIINKEELEQADRMGVYKEPVYTTTLFGFHLDDVELFYLNDNENKEMTLRIDREYFVIKYDLSILNKLKIKFNS